MLPPLAFAETIFALLLALVAIFLILLVLVQRGRGGGLAGALGGMGGSSAFGAKAGDVFTRITIGAAAVWILLCIAATRWGSTGKASLIDVQGGAGGSRTAATAGDRAGKDEPATKGGAGAAATTGSGAAADSGAAATGKTEPTGGDKTGAATTSTPPAGDSGAAPAAAEADGADGK